MNSRLRVAALTLPFALLACPGGPAGDPRYPKLPSGCDVQVFEQAPPGDTDNIGPVTASCGADVDDKDCLRTLKDQACDLGANVVWGVADKPAIEQGKKRFYGRAAHTRAK